MENTNKQIDGARAELVRIINTQKTDVIDPIAWKQINGMADTLIKSRALPQHIQNKEQAIVVMQAGYEMGMKPIQAINSLYIVNGQVTMWGKAIARQFTNHGYILDYKDEDDKTTVIAKKGDQTFTETYTLEEAEKSGYTKDRYGKLKLGWREGANRILKLRYGALNKLAKTKCAEVLGSAVGVAEVYQDSINPEEYTNTQDGEIVSDKKLDDELIKKINETKTHQELIQVCKAIKSEINAEYHNSLEAEYARRKEEISESNKEIK